MDSVISQVEDQIVVFNRTGQMLGYLWQDEPYFELQPGRWKMIPRRIYYQHLLDQPGLEVMLPTRPRWGYPDGLTLAAPMDASTGWGTFAINLAAEWVKQFPKELTLYPVSYWHEQGVPEPVVDLMRSRHRLTEWTLALTIPPELANIPSPHVVLFSMWETGQLPEGWGEMVNRYCEHLIVPSESQVDLWRRGGVTKNISVVPLGINPEIWQYQERPRRPEGRPFTILCYGSPLTSRKSPIETVTDVVWPALHDVDDWELILKTRGRVLGAGHLFAPMFEDPHITVISEVMDPVDLARLAYRADVGIALSKYEGYGLPFREMMATGLPVIVAENTGHLEDCIPAYCDPVPSKRVIPAEEGYYSPGENWLWEEPDWNQAAAFLRSEYEQWKERGRTQSPVGRGAAEYILEHRTWDRTMRHVRSLVNEIIARGV